MRQIRLKIVPGDGVGREVMSAGLSVLRELSRQHGGIRIEFDEVNWGCEYYLKHGRMMPEDGLSILADCDAILLGAVGFPGIPDHISLRGLLLPIRFGFDQYINLRPIRLLKGLRSPLSVSHEGEIDFVVVRENTEGEYCGKGRFEMEGTPEERAIQEAWFSRRGTERVIRYAFEYAKGRGLTHVVSATKSNSLNYSMVFWDRVFDEVRKNYPGIEARSILIDALSAMFILKPAMFEVVVSSNLFGDILTDLGAAMAGSIGIAPSANLNPEGKYPSMFEPVHGSAPDIAGKGIANPVGMFWSIVMMLEHLGLSDCGKELMSSIEMTIANGILTPDLGGSHSTAQVVQAVNEKIVQQEFVTRNGYK